MARKVEVRCYECSDSVDDICAMVIDPGELLHCTANILLVAFGASNEVNDITGSAG